MNKQVEISSQRLIIKTMQVEQITPEYIEGLNDPEVNKFLTAPRLKKQTKSTVKEYILGNLNSPGSLMLAICLNQEGVFIGTIRIGDISSFHYSCTVGICFFNKTYWKKGYASEALGRVVEFMFKELNLHYVEAGVYSTNIASKKLFERVGFKTQTIHKDKYRYLEDFREVIIFSKSNPDFDYSLLKITRREA